MKVLVTGSNGFLGSALVHALLASRPELTLRCLVRPGSDVSRLEPLSEQFPERLKIQRGTLSRPDDCAAAVADVQQVYHLAAGLSGPAVELFTNGSVATRNLLDAMVALDTCPELVFCSSFGVYGVANMPRGALLDETTELEAEPHRRDLYSYAKLHQERLVWRYHEQHQFKLAVLRPGVIYGPGGPAISGRVGVNLFGLYLRLGGNNLLPLSYVDNCADAFVAAGRVVGQQSPVTVNVVDDDLVTARQFLRRYRKEVRWMPVLPLAYPVMRQLSRLVHWYSTWSGGQLPAIFTAYKTDSIWKGNRFSNQRLKDLGWQRRVSTADGLSRHFQALAKDGR